MFQLSLSRFSVSNISISVLLFLVCWHFFCNAQCNSNLIVDTAQLHVLFINLYKEGLQLTLFFVFFYS